MKWLALGVLLLGGCTFLHIHGNGNTVNVDKLGSAIETEIKSK